LFSRWKVQRALPRDDAEDDLVVEGLVVAPARDVEERVVVAEAARVVQKMADVQTRAVVGQLRQPFPHVVVDRQLSFRCRQRDGERRELLRQRADVEHARRCDRHVVLEVGDAVAALVRDAAVAIDSHRTACGAGIGDVGKDGVGLRRPRRWALRRHARAKRERERQEDKNCSFHLHGSRRSPDSTPRMLGTGLDIGYHRVS